MAESNRSIVERFEKAFAANDIEASRTLAIPISSITIPCPIRSRDSADSRRRSRSTSRSFPTRRSKRSDAPQTVRSSSRDGRSQ